jgi:tRNA(Ile)-lysidine synthase
MQLLQQFKENWASKGYIRPGQTALLAVSGGSDSMVMADLFLKTGIPFGVAHCNFGLRGEASDLDERLVSEWCSEHKIQFHTTKFNTKEKTIEWKKGVQETARILRYEWFEEVRQVNGYAKVATAHHANDNMETLLINLFKGTGISGLHGILPENGNIIRPMLFAPKEIITAYIAENNIKYRDDASNDSDDYLRNAVRHHIVSAVTQWFPNVVSHVSESIERFSQAEVLYKKAIGQERKKLIEQRGQDHYIPILKLRNREPLATVVYELLLPFGFTSGQVPHVLNLLDAETGHYITSPSHRIIRNRNFLIVTAIPQDAADLIVVEGAPCNIDTGKYLFSFSIQDKPKSIPTSSDVAYIDLKGIDFPILLRKWKTGDYLYPLGMKMKKKKVSRLLIDEKVAIHEKEEVRILEINKRIAWVSGIRLDERFKIKDSTDKVLVVERKPKN